MFLSDFWFILFEFLLLDLNYRHSMWTVALLLLIGVSGSLGRVYSRSEINWPTDEVSTDKDSELMLSE